MDTTIFYAINHGTKNQFFDWLMPIITDFKSWIPLLLIFFGYLIWKNPKRGLIIFATVLLAVALGDFINHRIFKEIFERVRPCNALPDVNLLTGCSGSYSFPSSHAINSFTIAICLGFIERKALVVGIILASTVAFSRVYLGVHYPLDVTVGSLLGMLLGYSAFKVATPYLPDNGSSEKGKE